MASRQKTFESFLARNDYSDFALQVARWNYLANGKDIVNGKDKQAFQWTLIQEEVEEIIDAVKEGNKKQTLAEICDLFVVSSYLAFLKIHENNKGAGVDTVVQKMGEYLYAPRTKERLSLFGIDESVANQETYSTLKWAVSALNQYGADSMYALQAIIDANYTKFPLVTELIQAYAEHNIPTDADNTVFHGLCTQECLRIEEEFKGRYKGVTCEHVILDDNDLVGRLIFRDDQGKILKPLTFKKADISSFC